MSSRRIALAAIAAALSFSAVPAVAAASNPVNLGSKCWATAGLPKFTTDGTGVYGPAEIDCTGPATIGWNNNGVWLQALTNGAFHEIAGSASGPLGPTYNCQAQRNYSRVLSAASLLGMTVRTALSAYANGNYGQAQGTAVTFSISHSPQSGQVVSPDAASWS